MIKIKNLKKCSGCRACVDVCPKNAIAFVTVNGFSYPEADAKKCDDCGRCEEICPLLHSLPVSRGESAYIAYTDEFVRKQSSAGGVFAILALRTLASGGVVFGAAYNDDGGCTHRYIDDADDLHLLLGRKYVESDISDSYIRAKQFLLEERDVLFSGTPCQIAGLKYFLNAPYPNLFTVEVGCGGVAGEAVWRSFLEYMDGPKKVEIVDNADGEENRAGIRFIYENGDEKTLSRRDIAIHKAITQGLGIRPSCKDCTIGKKKSCADVTLRRYNPAIDDGGLNIRRQPMTMVICRNAFGVRALSESAPLLTIKEISREEAYRHILRSDKEKRYADRSAAFVKAISDMPFDEALEKYSKKGVFEGLFKAIASIFVK